MLHSKRGAPWIAVSPDVIVVGNVCSPDGLLQEEEKQVIVVEMKTVETISRAKRAVEQHGSLVYCKYGDEKLCDCVPADNQKQLLHQVTVPDLQYGMLVTAMAFKEEYQILQYVIVCFSQDDRDEHYTVVESVGKKII
jgi:hypothetical protein